MKNSARTADRILAAASEIVCADGLGALGVNAITVRSGVSKPLIYRYFGGLDGVVDALRDRSGIADLLSLPIGNIGPDHVVKVARQLAQNQLALQLLAADLSGPEQIATKSAKRASMKEAKMAMMMGAICFVLMRSHKQGEWMGLSLATPNDLAVFESAAYSLFSKGGV